MNPLHNKWESTGHMRGEREGGGGGGGGQPIHRFGARRTKKGPIALVIDFYFDF